MRTVPSSLPIDSWRWWHHHGLLLHVIVLIFLSFIFTFAGLVTQPLVHLYPSDQPGLPRNFFGAIYMLLMRRKKHILQVNVAMGNGRGRWSGRRRGAPCEEHHGRGTPSPEPPRQGAGRALAWWWDGWIRDDQGHAPAQSINHITSTSSPLQFAPTSSSHVEVRR